MLCQLYCTWMLASSSSLSLKLTTTIIDINCYFLFDTFHLQHCLIDGRKLDQKAKLHVPERNVNYDNYKMSY